MRSYNNTALRGDFTDDNIDSGKKKGKLTTRYSICRVVNAKRAPFFITNSPPKCNCRGVLGCTYAALKLMRVRNTEKKGEEVVPAKAEGRVLVLKSNNVSINL